MASVNEARMPLLDHLRELRKRVLRSAIAVLVAFGGGWYFYDSIIVKSKLNCLMKAIRSIVGIIYSCRDCIFFTVKNVRSNMNQI